MTEQDRAVRRSPQYGCEVFIETTSRVAMWKVMRGTVAGYAVPVDNQWYHAQEEACVAAQAYAAKWGDAYKGEYFYDEDADERREWAA